MPRTLKPLLEHLPLSLWAGQGPQAAADIWNQLQGAGRAQSSDQGWALTLYLLKALVIYFLFWPQFSHLENGCIW